MQTSKFKKGVLYIRINSVTFKHLKKVEEWLSEFLNDYCKNNVKLTVIDLIRKGRSL